MGQEICMWLVRGSIGARQLAHACTHLRHLAPLQPACSEANNDSMSEHSSAACSSAHSAPAGGMVRVVTAGIWAPGCKLELAAVRADSTAPYRSAAALVVSGAWVTTVAAAQLSAGAGAAPACCWSRRCHQRRGPAGGGGRRWGQSAGELGLLTRRLRGRPLDTRRQPWTAACPGFGLRALPAAALKAQPIDKEERFHGAACSLHRRRSPTRPNRAVVGFPAQPPLSHTTATHLQTLRAWPQPPPAAPGPGAAAGRGPPGQHGPSWTAILCLQTSRGCARCARRLSGWKAMPIWEGKPRQASTGPSRHGGLTPASTLTPALLLPASNVVTD